LLFLVMRKLIFITILFISFGCKSQNAKKMNQPFTNELINSTSPYLLQHAHNPVNWQPWSNELVIQAKSEKKLLLISIGYSACHWCHVMEHESFEDLEVAELMNKNFICVKIDREERPDVDHYYMTAVQLMQQRGGWPLNVIALPDGRPIWGGTYFQKENWKKNILAVSNYYRQNKSKTEEYAESLQSGIHQASLIVEIEDAVSVDAKLLERGVNNWKGRFDMKEGGNSGSPKFPMPVNLDFLLYYGFMNNDEKSLEFVETTLNKMARGGIYDQIGGGFSRYSVDDKWKIPHFEKMLYDNGQLLSVYSNAYTQFKNEEFKSVVYETVDFLKRELMDESGAFYSSLDADSEGEEGKFYVWNAVELKNILKDDFELFSNYFNVNSKGLWENGNYILLRGKTDEKFVENHKLSHHQFQKKVLSWKSNLLNERGKRVRPGLDDKTLTSWNALVITGLLDAYKSFKEREFLNLAIKNANFLKENVMLADGKLFHNWKNGNATVDGFLEDYALLIQAYISLYEVSGDPEWLNLAGKLTAYTFNNFYDEKSGLFYFSDKNNNSIVVNHFQKEDNVLPASNSVMVNNLHKLYLILGRAEYSAMVNKMLQHITPHFAKYPMAYANWGKLMMKVTMPFFEVVIVGENAENVLHEMQHSFQPNILWAFSEKSTEIPILKDRHVKGKTLIYVCEDGICQLPLEDVKSASSLLRSEK